eukprot:CAMPEP_0198297584 /NCGR_PEP_ID=MMETSP1449-20131203/37331_1 /TAXON_ID=420275 /ORGANISM="Attheya septentrionalis, Strain CCMP2084" /LENGTH=547 /DNA_ID=CAMNT_0043998559 /DNA_START=442 /DNA_END=2085 /DNA_ORIENTATION=-
MTWLAIVVLVMVLNQAPSVSHGWSIGGNQVGCHAQRRHDRHFPFSALHHHPKEKKINHCNDPTRTLICRDGDAFLDEEGEKLSGGNGSSPPYDRRPTKVTTISGQQQQRYPVPSSRRDLFRAGAAGLLFLTATTTTTCTLFDNSNSVVAVAQEYKPGVVKKQVKACMELVPINITKVASENKINVTLTSKDGCVSVDRKTFAKIITRDYPAWVPSIFRKNQQTLRVIPNSELLVASLVAGATTEVVRTGLLYPLSTIKARIQATKTTPSSPSSWNETKAQQSSITTNNETTEENVLHSFLGQSEQGLETLFLTFYRQAKEGNLYAGIVPTLLVTVPAAGVYAGVRDVSKRMLAIMLPNDAILVSLLAALVADVVALAVRTPADALALRLQVASRNTSDETAAGNWFSDSLKRLGPIIWTDLPNLLLRIALTNYWMTTISGMDEQPMSQFEVETIFLACLCAAVTTPFDVARTRILIDQRNITSTSTPTTTNVLATMQSIVREGGISKLYSGWAERTLYLGIARASLDPIRILSYMGIRDAVLLKWFD